jgi:hypothetical protein
MGRCPNGSRKYKGTCVKKSEIKKRCPNGTRKYKGECVKKSGVKKRCPNGTRKYKGECVSKKRKSTSSGLSSKKNIEYIITIHNSNGTQIKDVDYSIDYPLDLIESVEREAKLHGSITPLNDSHIPDYIKVMNYNKKDISDEELGSVYFCELESSISKYNYSIKHNGKTYIVKFQPVD